MLTLQRAATQAGWSNAKIIESFTSYENLLRVQEINQKAKNACYHLFTTAGVPAIRQKPNNSQLIVDTIMTFLNKRKEHLGRPFATHDWIQTPKGPKNIRQLKSEKNFRKQLLHAWHEEGKEEVDLDQKLSDFVRCNKDFFPELWGCRCGGALEVNPG